MFAIYISTSRLQVFIRRIYSQELMRYRTYEDHTKSKTKQKIFFICLYNFICMLIYFSVAILKIDIFLFTQRCYHVTILCWWWHHKKIDSYNSETNRNGVSEERNRFLYDKIKNIMTCNSIVWQRYVMVFLIIIGEF